MAYQEGDTSPPHTNVHNDVRTQLDQLSTEFEIPVVLPPVVGLGDVGHVDHHNLLTTAIADLSKHECEEGLPGIGGFATITAVSGTYTKHPVYEDGGTDWVAYEWMGTKSNSPTLGSFTIAEDGVIEVLCIGGGNANSHPSAKGNGGNLQQGVMLAKSGRHDVQASNAGLNNSWDVGTSFIRDLCGGPKQTGAGGGGAGSWVTGANIDDGYFSSINGTRIEYGPAGKPNAIGGGQLPNTPNSYAGVGTVIIRVPAANATATRENPHGWDSFALVTDGVVTDVTRVPDNEPHTLDAEWLPCPAEVQPGWEHTDGEFTPPPAPTREDLIAELQDQIKDLQKDTK